MPEDPIRAPARRGPDRARRGDTVSVFAADAAGDVPVAPRSASRGRRRVPPISSRGSRRRVPRSGRFRGPSRRRAPSACSRPTCGRPVRSRSCAPTACGGALAPPDDVTFWVGPEGLAYRSAHGHGRATRARARGWRGALEDLHELLGGDVSRLAERWSLTVLRDDASGAEIEAAPLAVDAGCGVVCPAVALRAGARTSCVPRGSCSSRESATAPSSTSASCRSTLRSTNRRCARRREPNAAIIRRIERPTPRSNGSFACCAGPPRRRVHGGERSTADDSALWSAHERALVRARDAGAAAQRIASSAARQRASMDAVADRARALSSRAAELQGGFARVVDAFERLGSVALNAGLEGARLGESRGAAARPRERRGARALVARRGTQRASSGRARAARAASWRSSSRRWRQAQVVVAEVTQDSARARRRGERRGVGARRHRRARQEGDRKRSGDRARHRRGERARARARRVALRR